MTLETILPLIFLAVTAGGLFLLHRIFTYGGLSGAMFGATIRRTLGEAKASGGFITGVIRVHILDGKPEKVVGLEVMTRSIASYQVEPVSFSADEARKLAALIQSAATGRQGP
jgi:hypothetical protein